MKRSLLSRGAYVFAIRALPALSITVASILIARRLPEAVNGAYQKIWLYVAVLVAIGSVGLPALAITHSLSRLHRWLRRLKARQATLFVLVNLAAAILLGQVLPGNNVHPFAISLLYLAQLASLLSETYLVVADRFRILVLVIVPYTAGFLGIHFAFLRADISLNTLISCAGALLMMKAALQTAAGIRHYLPGRRSIRPGRMPNAVRSQWIQLGLYDISQLVFRYLDKLLVTWLVGPAAFAVYMMGTIDIPVLPLLLGAAGTAILRQLSTGQSDVESRLQVLQVSSSTLARIVFPIFGFLFMFRTEIVLQVFGEKYEAAIPLFGISVLAIPLRAYNFTAMLQHLNRVRLINLGALLDLLLALILSVPLYFWLGLPGVAISFTVCSYFQAAFYLYHTSRILGRPVTDLIPFSEITLLLIAFVAAESVAHKLLTEMMSGAYTLLLGAGITAVLIAGALATMISRKGNPR